MGGPQRGGRGDTDRSESLCGQGHSILQRRFHVRGHAPFGGTQAPAVRLGDSASGLRGRPEARSPEGSPD
eukprot:14350061-Alexandrium_andersonii.AAC.1